MIAKTLYMLVSVPDWTVEGGAGLRRQFAMAYAAAKSRGRQLRFPVSYPRNVADGSWAC